MVNLNLFKRQGWLTVNQIIEKHGTSNPSLMRKIIGEKGKEFRSERKIILKRKDGNNDYLYSPLFVSKVSNSFLLESYYASEAKRTSLKKEECYTAKHLASEFRTTQIALVGYINSKNIEKTGLIKETEKEILVHKSLYFELRGHFLSNFKPEFRQESHYKFL